MSFWLSLVLSLSLSLLASAVPIAVDCTNSCPTTCLHYSIAFNGGSAANNPTLTLQAGTTYEVTLNNCDVHPFCIRNAGDDSLYANTTGNCGTSSVTITVPSTQTTNLLYRCNNHSPMTGSIIVTGGVAPPTDPPAAAPQGHPTAAPVAPPTTAAPTAAPVTAPVAAPTTAPVTAPVAGPVAAPKAPTAAPVGNTGSALSPLTSGLLLALAAVFALAF